VAHTHKISKWGLKHSHDIPPPYEASSGVTHKHNNIAHRHRLPEGKLKHVHNNASSENAIDSKNESVDGQIYSLSDVSETHNTLMASFFLISNRRLFEQCRVWQSNTKVLGKTNNNTQFSYYPDIVAACSENVSGSSVRTDPVLIAEVLSPSTQRTHLVEKFNNYTTIPSLMEYVVISQDPPLVRIYRRRNAWMLESYYPEDHFFLNSLNQTINVSDIYRRVRGGGER
jgi:Uma2 family endonuclease